MGLIMGQTLSASGVDGSCEASAAIGDQPPHVVAGEELKQISDSRYRQPWDAKRSTSRWETSARGKVRTAVRRFREPLNALAVLAESDAIEGGARLLVTDFLCDGLRFDKHEDPTTTVRVRWGRLTSSTSAASLSRISFRLAADGETRKSLS